MSAIRPEITITSDSSTRTNARTIREDTVLRRAEWIAELFDQRFRVPGTSLRFGYDAIIGLVPVAGDFLGVMVSLYRLIEAVRLRIGVGPVARMLLNIVIDWCVGLIPLADVFLDAAFKANTRNARILASALGRE